ncbi:MAG TPA: hypothetical protein VFX16_15230 [Pseudonocardiaceae bacterium]|nr:hypothetical protein [Pseudonocardiaceae bacterium]
MIAPAVPLRGLARDAEYVTAIVRTVHGPVVIAGHSYGIPPAAERFEAQRVGATIYTVTRAFGLSGTCARLG